MVIHIRIKVANSTLRMHLYMWSNQFNGLAFHLISLTYISIDLCSVEARVIISTGSTKLNPVLFAYFQDGRQLLGLNLYILVVNHCFTSLFGTKGLLSDIIIR